MQRYYAILGLTYPATQEEIKKAFYKLAHKYHPDKPEGNEQRFKEINNAYQILCKQRSAPEPVYQQPMRRHSYEMHFTTSTGRSSKTVYDANTGTFYTITW
jgi:DnaJ-class molecular chaperone